MKERKLPYDPAVPLLGICIQRAVELTNRKVQLNLPHSLSGGSVCGGLP